MPGNCRCELFLFILANCHPGLLVCKLSMCIVFSSNFADCLSYRRFNNMSFWSSFCCCKFWQLFCKKSFPIMYFANFINCLSGQSFCNFLFHVMWHQNNQSDQGEVAYEIRPIFSSRFQNKPLDLERNSLMSRMFIWRTIRKSDNIEARGGKLFGKLYFRERRKGLKKGFEKSSFEVLVDKMLCSGLDNFYVKSLYNEKN